MTAPGSPYDADRADAASGVVSYPVSATLPRRPVDDLFQHALLFDRGYRVEVASASSDLAGAGLTIRSGRVFCSLPWDDFARDGSGTSL